MSALSSASLLTQSMGPTTTPLSKEEPAPSTSARDERREKRKKQMTKRKSMMSMNMKVMLKKDAGDKKEGDTDVSISSPGASVTSPSSPDPVMSKNPIPPGTTVFLPTKKVKKGKFPEDSDLPPHGYYIIKVDDYAGWRGCVRGVSSGRFRIDKVDLQNIGDISDEFVFQHQHYHLKSGKGSLSGFRNIKYQKYLSRPFVGEKLMGTNFLEAREAVNIFDPHWTMYKEKQKDPLCITEIKLDDTTSELAVGKSSHLTFTLLRVDDELIEN